TRPGVFFQNLAGLIVLRRYSQYEKSDIKLAPILFTCLGAIIGAFCAGIISNDAFDVVASIVLVFLTVQYLVPLPVKREEKGHRRKYLQSVLFVLVGFYAGFIQIGIGILLLAILLNQLSMPYAQANAYKLIIILIYTVPTTIYFAVTDVILWRPALLITVGQVVGAAGAAAFISKNSRAKEVAKWTTIVMIIITLVKIWLF
ncbi:MAG: sulfite exporter TauE/SafE family protein, partial [Bacteroidota bacterium]